MKLRLQELVLALLPTLLPALPLSASDGGRTFAIVIDAATYTACRAEVDAYRDAVTAEGTEAFVEARKWENPEEVSGFLRASYSARKLAGAVFIGDIPVVMVSRAQHLTSAFKMKQDPADLFNTSVPTDRFYDDFDLKFDYVCAQDTLGARYFYYNLSGFGAQAIECDIYSGRIKPTLDGEQGYAQVRKYLRKAVAEKKSGNRADRIVSFTGDGSFSNSLIAWKDEGITLREQFPEAFTCSDGAKFYFFSMYPTIKEIIIKELGREDLDIALFHEHGDPDTQYVDASQPVTDAYSSRTQIREDLYHGVQRHLRSSVKVKMRYGSSREEAIADLSGRYGLDSAWFVSVGDPEAEKEDSVRTAKSRIVTREVPAIAPNSRITVFDACYNGDFREKDCIGSAYIFSDGKAVVSLGNSVNVLQDKYSSGLLGLVAAGYNIGQVCQMTNILESHIIGDPTMHFASAADAPDFYNEDISYWKQVLGEAASADMRSLALYKLHRLGCDGMPSILLDTYRGSGDYTVRLECLLLAAYYGGDSYIELLKDALDDPYEFIRRKAVYWCGETGNPDFAPLIADMYLSDYMALRLDFNMSTAAGYYGDAVKEALSEKVADGFVFDKEAFLAEAGRKFDSSASTRKYMADLITNPGTSPARFSSYINSVRNSPDPALASSLIGIVADPSRDIQVRIDAAEALGWYVRYSGKGEIIEAFEKQLPAESDKGLRDELAKTVNRLKAYSR